MAIKTGPTCMTIMLHIMITGNVVLSIMCLRYKVMG